MKFGQLLSFIVEALPEDAQKALASLQSDAPPMAPEAAAKVVARRARRAARAGVPRLVSRCRSPRRASARCTAPSPATAGEVAVKVQYPGVGAAIEADLDNAEGAVPAVRRVRPEGARRQGARRRAARPDARRARLHDRGGQPDRVRRRTSPAIRSSASRRSIRPPARRRVLTTEWVDGHRLRRVPRRRPTTARQATRRRDRSGASPSTPCTTSARSTAIRTRATTASTVDGDVTFLDFGLVKRWTAGEWQQLAPSLDAIVVHRDPERLVVAMEDVGFLRPGHGLAAAGRLRLRQRAVPALPHRRVHVHPHVRARRAGNGSSTSRARTPT